MMKIRFILLPVLLTGLAAFVYAVFQPPHQFSERDCSICHIDAENSPDAIKSDVTYSCEICHADHTAAQSHPTDVNPTVAIPNDMPLLKGKITCLTCHYAHAADKNPFRRKNHYFLRRPIRGILFCSSCHKIDERRHIVFGNVHKGVYEETDSNTRIDQMTLECIECHDRQMTQEQSQKLGAGRWTHFGQEFNHPIGAVYKDFANKYMNKFRPEMTLRKEVKLFNGKIGCGTCHNVYSKEKGMLIMSNLGGNLCTECHVK